MIELVAALFFVPVIAVGVVALVAMLCSPSFWRGKK